MSQPSTYTRRQFNGRLSMALPLLATGHRHLLALTDSVSATWTPLAFGAMGDGKKNDTAAIQAAIDACSRAGGGTVLLPANHAFLSGGLTLKSHVRLHLEGGSRLIASTNRSEYHATGALLFAQDAENLHISGTGEIFGNDTAFFSTKGPDGYTVPQPFLGPFDPLYDVTRRNPPDGRPRMILLVNCTNTLLEQFTIRRSPTWTIHPVGCEGLHISGISILNGLDIPNCDGIDVDHCRQVRIDSCNIVAGDDCLIVKASRNFGRFGTCENVTITNCTLESSSAGIKIETEGAFPLRSVVVSNCSIVRSNRGISFLNRDGAMVEDLLFTDMTIQTRMQTAMWWGSGEPIAVSSIPRVRGGAAGQIRGVRFANIVCRGESGIYLRGTVGAPLQDVSFLGIDLSIAKTTSIPGGFYDMRPGDQFGESGLDRRKIAGLFAADVEGLSLNGVHVHWSETVPYYGSAFELHHCTEVSMTECTGRAAHPNQPASLLEGVSMVKPVMPES